MRFLLVALLASAALHAGTVAELIAAVRAARQGPDTELAVMLRQVNLTERLDDAAIEQLQSEGAGPRTVEELEWLREDSSELPAPANLVLFDAPPALSPEEQTRLIERARAIALEYTRNLPNFLCTESVARHLRLKGKPWKATDTFTLDVGYSIKGEAYKLLTIDGKPTRKKLKDVGGFRSEGEFGSQLRHIYRPQAAARFQWERWSNLRGRRVAVFSYRIDRRNSSYTVSADGGLFRRYRLETGVIGEVYIDPETASTLRFSGGADGLPPNWPIRSTYSVVDYETATVAGQEFLLPKRVDVRVALRESRVRNLMAFENYRKFTSDVTVTFEKQ